MSMAVKGRIKNIFDERYIKEGFNIREMVLTIDEETPYPQTVLFTMINDNCDQIIGKHVGDKVEVMFNLTGKYSARPQNGSNHLPFTNLNIYRIYKEEGE